MSECTEHYTVKKSMILGKGLMKRDEDLRLFLPPSPTYILKKELWYKFESYIYIKKVFIPSGIK